MQIDWPTVVAQIVNFLVLVYILKRLLYRPIINAMQRREQRIAERIHEAEEREQAAERETQRYQDKSREFDQKRDQLWSETREEVDRERKQLIDQARQEVEEMRRNWERELEREQDERMKTARKRAADSVVAISRRALADLADKALEQQIVEVFSDRLAELSDEERKKLVAARAPARVITAFEPSWDLRSMIEDAVQEHLGDIELQYECNNELICGIELVINGQKLDWTIANYFEQLEQRIHQALAGGTRTA